MFIDELDPMSKTEFATVIVLNIIYSATFALFLTLTV